MDNSNVIIILRALNQETSDVCECAHNEGFLFLSSHNTSQTSEPEDTTPAPISKASLALTLDRLPYDADLGFVFGSKDDDECDVLLSLRNPQNPGRNRGISRKHFRIDFNWDNEALILYNESQFGTELVSPLAGTQHLKKGNSFPLFDGSTIRVSQIAFEIEIPPRNASEAEKYRENWCRVKQDCQQALGKHAGPPATSYPVTVAYQRRVVLYGMIAQGNFGSVFKGIDEQGYLVAVKQPCDHLSEESETKFRREINFLQDLQHEHVITVFNDRIVVGDTLSLVMEFAPLGSLANQERMSLEEVTQVIKQTLKGIVFIHGKGVAHRDLKPANILVTSRSPIWVKISDFGLSGEGLLTSFLGTEMYCAPEVARNNGAYTTLTDIWSVGVIMLEYSFFAGLPEHTGEPFKSAELLQKCNYRYRPGWTHFGELARRLACDIQSRPNPQECIALLDALSPTSQPDLHANFKFLQDQGDVKLPRVFKFMKLDENRRPSIGINLGAICRMNNVNDKVINDNLKRVPEEPKYCLEGDIHTTPGFAAKFLKPFSSELACVIERVQQEYEYAHLSPRSGG